MAQLRGRASFPSIVDRNPHDERRAAPPRWRPSSRGRCGAHRVSRGRRRWPRPAAAPRRHAGHRRPRRPCTAPWVSREIPVPSLERSVGVAEDLGSSGTRGAATGTRGAATRGDENDGFAPLDLAREPPLVSLFDAIDQKEAPRCPAWVVHAHDARLEEGDRPVGRSGASSAGRTIDILIWIRAARAAHCRTLIAGASVAADCRAGAGSRPRSLSRCGADARRATASDIVPDVN